MHSDSALSCPAGNVPATSGWIISWHTY